MRAIALLAFFLAGCTACNRGLVEETRRTALLAQHRLQLVVRELESLPDAHLSPERRRVEAERLLKRKAAIERDVDQALLEHYRARIDCGD